MHYAECVGQIALCLPHPSSLPTKSGENCPLSTRRGEGAKQICDKQICLGVRRNCAICPTLYAEYLLHFSMLVTCGS